jgi:zinc protease
MQVRYWKRKTNKVWAHFYRAHGRLTEPPDSPKNSLVHWLESIGMRFGPETNAYTSFDETVYQLSIPLDDPKILDTALNILGIGPDTLPWQRKKSKKSEE